MGKIAIFNVPAMGHINPTLPVVSELVNRGEQVVYYVFRDFCEAVQSTGADVRPLDNVLGYDYRRRAKSLCHLAATLLKYSLAYIPPLLDEVQREKFDVAMFDCLCPWGRCVARVLKLPAICSSSTFAMHRDMLRNSMSPLNLPYTVIRGAAAYLHFRILARRLKKKYGLQDLGLFDTLTNHADLNLVYTSREFQPLADRFDDSYRFVGPSLNEPGQQESDLPFAELEGKPIIYISLGTVGNEQLPFYRCCMDAFGDLENPVIMTVGTKVKIANLGTLPSNFIVRNEAPPLEVLKRASLCLNHGGSIVSESLYYGVPVIVYPPTAEHRLRGRLVQQKKAGTMITKRDLKPDRLRQITLSVLNNAEIHKSAATIARSFKDAGGYRRAAQEVIEFRERLAVQASK